MVGMKQFWGTKQFVIGLIASALLGTVSCSRPVGVPTVEGSTQSDQAPFRDDGTRSGNPSLADFSSARDGNPNAGNSVPFHDLRGIPVGTILIIRLKDLVSADTVVANNSFQAVVDEPVLGQGETLIPRGAIVTGHVESVGTSSVKPNRGYLRLVLATVHVGALDVPVQTASLFVRQAPGNGVSASKVQLEKGRRLTFRLTEPLYASTQTLHAIR